MKDKVKTHCAFSQSQSNGEAAHTGAGKQREAHNPEQEDDAPCEEATLSGCAPQR